MIIPFFHLFKTPGAYYIYDVNKNSILNISRRVYEILNDVKSGMDDLEKIKMYESEEYSFINKMMENGFLSSNRCKEIRHPMDDVLENMLSNKLWLIILQVTQQCNLKCDYCVYSGNYNNRQHSNKKMDFETAKKCIDFLVEHSNDTKRAAFGFYGGEPLLEFELIKKCIEYVEEKTEGKELILTITTNATLLNDKIIRYFDRHNVQLMISLDGPSELQDKNRKFAANGTGTFECVMKNLNNMKEKFPDYFHKISFNAVLDFKGDFKCVDKFFADYDTVCESVLSVSAISDNYSIKPEKPSDDFVNAISYEYFKLFLSKLGRFDEKYVSKLISYHYDETRKTYESLKPSNGIQERAHPSGPCIPGVTRLFVNAEGDMFPCERVSENSEVMKIGNIDTGFDIGKIKNLLNIGKLTEEKCKNCWALRFCTLCAQAADNLNELNACKKASKCSGELESIESKLMDICTLREMGMSFEDYIA